MKKEISSDESLKQAKKAGNNRKIRKHIVPKSHKERNIRKNCANRWELVYRQTKYQQATARDIYRYVTEDIVETIFENGYISLHNQNNTNSEKVQSRILRRIVEKRQAQLMHRRLRKRDDRFIHHMISYNTSKSMRKLQVT